MYEYIYIYTYIYTSASFRLSPMTSPAQRGYTQLIQVSAPRRI